jgi:hypothetical protein
MASCRIFLLPYRLFLGNQKRRIRKDPFQFLAELLQLQTLSVKLLDSPFVSGLALCHLELDIGDVVLHETDLVSETSIANVASCHCIAKQELFQIRDVSLKTNFGFVSRTAFGPGTRTSLESNEVPATGIAGTVHDGHCSLAGKRLFTHAV